MKMYIRGQACDASDGKTIDVVNPATGEIVDTIPAATAKDVDDAIAYAVEGQKRWVKEFPLYKRIALFRTLKAVCETRRDEIARMLTLESGRPITEAYMDLEGFYLQLEAQTAAAQCLLGGRTIPFGSEPGKEADFQYTIREPLGVLISLPGFNGPLNQFGKKAVAALLAGNSVIHKPPTDDPLSTIMLVELLYEAGIPKYALQLITGRGRDCGDLLTGDPRIAGVSVTGSTKVGLRIAEQLAKGLKYSQLELGGNAPQIVCADADIDLCVKESVMLRAVPRMGQICASSKRFIIHSSVKDEFVEKLVKELSRYEFGDPMDPETKMGTLISEAAAKNVEKQVQLTIDQGAELVYGHVRKGAYYLPTVLDHCTADMDVAHNMEIFGPVFPIFTFDDIEDAVALANDTDYGLGSSIFTRDHALALQVAGQIEAGTVVVNGQAAYTEMRAPFGGPKMSGNSREGQYENLMQMTQEKHIVLKNILRS